MKRGEIFWNQVVKEAKKLPPPMWIVVLMVPGVMTVWAFWLIAKSLIKIRKSKC